MPRFNPITWNFVAKRINELYFDPKRKPPPTTPPGELVVRFDTLNEVMKHFADHFEKDNPKFERMHFIDACISSRD